MTTITSTRGERREGRRKGWAVHATDRDVMPGTETFRAFYRREFERVLALAISLSRDRSEAEDVAQEAFTRTYREWDRVAHYDDPGAWVRRVAVNLIHSRYRKLQSRRKAMTRLTLAAEPSAALSPRDDEFWREVRALPHQQAAALALHYVDDRPIAEIAAILGVAEGTVKSHLHRGRRALAERLGLEEGGPR